MNLINLSTEIWEKSEKIIVKGTKDWNESFFLKEWFEEFDDPKKYLPNSPGWYWIACNIEFEELLKVCPTKKEIPGGACKIKSVSEGNLKIFGEQNLCKKEDGGSLIIYNGHQRNVINRVRQHFILNNERTGAIGLKHYPLSNRIWTLNFFSEKHLDRLSPASREQVKTLIKESTGRVAIENAWRAKYGWPILCKA